jgi:hypothetical protein
MNKNWQYFVEFNISDLYIHLLDPDSSQLENKSELLLDYILTKKVAFVNYECHCYPQQMSF